MTNNLLTKYAVFYAINLPFGFDELPSILTEDQILKDFVYVGSFECQNKDALFERLNTHEQQDLGYSDYGPGSEVPSHQPEIMQRFVARKAGHTSMSVGDLCIDLSTGVPYLCNRSGWKGIGIEKTPARRPRAYRYRLTRAIQPANQATYRSTQGYTGRLPGLALYG